MKLGIIGGSGLENPELLKDAKEINVETPYGSPSSSLMCGKIEDVEVCIISRHGKKHEISPTHVNNRANIAALAKQGCTHILATTAAGSLREEIKRKDFVILDQLIDFTRHREITFHDKFENGPVHVSLAEPFSKFLRTILIESAKELGLRHHEKGTVITIEGPRFSTKAESKLFRQWGADVINMSVAPEATLAKEAGLEYAAIAMSTDYDCWKEDEAPVTWDDIIRIMNENSENVKKLLLNAVKKLSHNSRFAKDAEFIKSKIRTIPHFPKQGIMFRDITTLLKDKDGFAKAIELLVARYKDKDIDLIAGIESRGFVLASALASHLHKGLVLVRKPGKLPAEKVREEYDLEYGKDAIEIHKDAISQGQKILLVDDLIATGGTAAAACNLIEKLGGKIVECAFIVELPELHGKQKLARWPVFKLVEFEGE